jgi:hypothetical protein
VSDQLAFVDESLRPGRYFLGCVVIEGRIAGSVRRQVRKLLLPGQRRLHFQEESDQRRRQVLIGLAALDLDVTVYVCLHEMGRGAEQARAACLARLVRELQAGGLATELYVESRDGGDGRDRATIIHARQGTPVLTFHHLQPLDDPLLWLPDVYAWAVGAGGEWREQATPPARVLDVG